MSLRTRPRGCGSRAGRPSRPASREARKRRSEAFERLAAQRQQAARRHGFDRRRAGRAAQRRHDAERLRRRRALRRGPRGRRRAQHPHPAFLDQVHRAGWIALPVDDVVAVSSATRLELREHDAGDGFRRQARERRDVRKNACSRACLSLQFEVGADVRVRVDELPEFGRVEAQRQHVGARADGGGSRRAVEQLGFAEAVAGAQHVERDFIAGRRRA